MSRRANEFAGTPNGTFDDSCNMAQPTITSSLDGKYDNLILL